ncbi:prion-inhibition and propagation-domain-containing protein [Aspergillus cavernicola]|uniref:Prion-inhibition and propagation-domain-containing protein n=1 Tax=Aspergillus cavernicola TaxID=176166 RepID=A0ABR4IFD7_9EURO
MEVAGLVLSAVALFGSCLKGYQLVADIRGLGQDSAILLCRLQIEEKRLLIWGRAVGLTEERCRLPAQDLDIVQAVLTEINSITQDAAVMKKRYAASLGPVDNILYNDGPINYIQSSAVILDIKRRIDEKSRGSSQSLKAGLRWMLDRKGFEKLVVDLRELNNGLFALLYGSQTVSSFHEFNEICLLSSASDDVHKLATIRDASQTTYEDLSRTVDQRMHCLQLEASLPILNTDLATRVPLGSMVVVQSNTDANRSIARLGEELVLIEWREYGEDDPDDRTVIGILEKRIADLSILLGRSPKPKEFQVMDCVGYCHDELEKRFGIVYTLPTLEVDEIPEIVSLYDLIHPQAGAQKVFPSLNDRFRLSNILANSLLQLHTTKWLHRNLRSSHILFLKSSKSMDWLQAPYVCGFGYSRPDFNAISLPLQAREVDVGYQHPDLAQNPRVGYRREFDAYSLGVLLVEIGFWRPIANFRKPAYSPKRNHQRLLEYQLTGDLAHRMGRDFEQAVKLLLTGKAYGVSMMEGEQLVAFLQNVVIQTDCQGLN